MPGDVIKKHGRTCRGEGEAGAFEEPVWLGRTGGLRRQRWADWPQTGIPS